MGIIKRTSADAVKDAEGLETKAAELEAKAAEATATIERMEAESVDAIVDDPRQAEKIDAGITSQRRMAHAFTAKAAQYREKATTSYREALDLEAVELHREADKMDKQSAQHTAKVDGMLAQLKDLDGLEYGPSVRVKNVGGEWVDQVHSASVSAELRRNVESIRIKADNNLHYLATGRLAFDRYELNNELGSSHNTSVGVTRLSSHDRSDLLAQVTAGMTPRFTDSGGNSEWDGQLRGDDAEAFRESTMGRL